MIVSIVHDPEASSGFALLVMEGDKRRLFPLDIDALFKLNRETAEAILARHRRTERPER